MKIQAYQVFKFDNSLAIHLQAFAKFANYSDKYLLKLIKKLKKRKIKIGFKWKRNWYIFIPKKPINTSSSNSANVENIQTPSGEKVVINWQEVVNTVPFASTFTGSFNFFLQDGKLFVIIPAKDLVSLGLRSKTPFSPILLPPNKFQATTEYTYGYRIVYDRNKMSIFDPGTAGTLNSTQIPAAFFEVCRALDAAENLRNGSNPGLPPRRNLSTTVSFDTGTIAVAATLPVSVNVQTDGSIDITASDYLGATYSTFSGGGGTLKSDTLPEAFLELANILAAAEKAVTPADAQPNNIQIQFDIETGSATISANMPFTTEAASDGDVTIHAIDYL
ncbi:MAG: hypothetical protein HC903_27705 [Methylacidiphilales bacterium]|nr:hypothetical protein [Candidatus Methylacidiphilales bacterium]NJR19324.1 hypothetical protein [Calothrix sp. CSU_2_0]